MKNVLIRSLATASLLFSGFISAGNEVKNKKDDENKPPQGFEDYKKWLDNASLEERKEHFESLSENYIEKHGEDANNLRLCINLH